MPQRAISALALIAATACATATKQSPSSSVRSAYTAADVHFMTGMIHHHAQAVLIAGWAPTHDASQSLRALCERIVVAQRDEIAFALRWLQERHEEVPETGMAHHAMLMPGMLTPEQMAQLDAARSRTNGAEGCSPAAGRRTSPSGGRTRSSRSRTTRWRSRATTSCRRRRPRMRTVWRTMAR